MRGKLNTFQKLVLQWRAVHPLNAVHAVRLDGPPNVDRLRECFPEVVARLGLHGLVVDLGAGTYDYGCGTSPVETPWLRHATLDEAIESELNRPFPNGPYCPLRAFVYSQGPSHVLGVAYDHWIGDAASIAPVLAHTTCDYLGLPRPTSPAPDLYPPTLRHLLARHFTNETAARLLVHLGRTYTHLRRARRVRHTDATDQYNGFLLRCIPPGQYGALREAASALGATVHDLCMAALAKALADHVPPYRPGSERHGMGIGSVADLRHLVPARWRHAQSLLLCYITLVLDRPRSRDLATLTRHVASMTAPMKHTHTYLASLLNFRLGVKLAPHMPAERMMRFPLKNMPLCGGVSSFRLTSTMMPGNALRRVRQYIRAVSTGPTVPLVAQAAKLDDGLSFGISFRTTAISRDLAARIADAFLAELAAAHT